MKSIFTTALMIWAGTSLFSQKQDFKTNYKLSVCEGEIPAIYISNPLISAENYPNKIIENEFYENSYYNLSNMMKSGFVLFGDEISLYLNSVAQHVLSASGKSNLSNTIQVYVIKSSYPYYYTRIDGSIFISIGLLAQLENEAQLAFIISHEIVHYEEKHNAKSYEENKNLIITYNRDYLRNYAEFKHNLEENSKEKEFEADKLGLEIFNKAGYPTSEAKSTLQVLKYAHLPFDDLEFDKTYFNRENYTIPPSSFKLKTDEKEKSDKVDEEIIDARIEKFKESKEKPGNTYQLNKADFEYISMKAKFENQHLNLIERRFIRAVYESFILKNEYPSNVYLDECIAKGVYGMSKMKNYFERTSVSSEKLIDDQSEEESFEDECLILRNFLKNSSKEELNILATKLLLELENEKLMPYVEDLMKDLVMDMKFDTDDFIMTVEVELDTIKGINGKDSVIFKNNTFKLLDSLEYNNLSKIEKIVYTQKKAVYEQQLMVLDTNSTDEIDFTGKINKKYYLSAFINELKDTSFKNKYIKYSTDLTYRYYSDWYENLSSFEKSKIDKKNMKQNNNYEEYGLDSLFLLEPSYSYSEKNNRNNLNVPKTVKKEEYWIKSLRINTSKHNLHTVDLITTNQPTINIQKLNYSFAFAEWNRELFSSYRLKMLPMSMEIIYDIMEKEGCGKVLLSGVVGTSRETYCYVKVLDKNGYVDFSKYSSMPKKANRYTDAIFIQDMINQIAR